MVAGRPRSFDYDQALDGAMRVFWEKGFEGATMPDLTEAMNMNRPSIYATFGNKEGLFKKALQRYTEDSIKKIEEQLDVPSVRQAIENFLLGSAEAFASTERPRGCMAVQGALVGGSDAKEACEEAHATREAIVDVLAKRLDRGIKDGDLPQGTDTRQLARFYTTVLNGMSVQSVGGACCADLRAIAQTALTALPA
jgi:AcrR family transcriptional regulator